MIKEDVSKESLTLPLNKVLVGDCYEILKTFPKNSIDTVVTSPPYWALRDYDGNFKVWGGDINCEHEWKDDGDVFKAPAKDGAFSGVGEKETRGTLGYSKATGGVRDLGDTCVKCKAWRGQLGLEPHPQMFVDHLVDLGRLIKNVLKPTGLFWLNLGDTYYGSGVSNKPEWKGKESVGTPDKPKLISGNNWLQPKQLLLLPSRVACALQDDGWILRNDAIWFKPNHMPESINDRFTKSYEHFFMFSKQSRYYFNLDAVRVKYINPIIAGKKSEHTLQTIDSWDKIVEPNQDLTIETQESKENNLKTHYDSKFPEESGIGQYTQRLAKARADGLPHDNPLGNPLGKNPSDVWAINTKPFPGSHFAVFPEELVERIIKSSCPPNGIVLDPFSGSGTTLYVARQQGLDFIGIELKPEYARMAEQRVYGKTYNKKNENNKPLLIDDTTDADVFFNQVK